MNFSFVQITDHHLREKETTLTRGYSTAYAFRAVMRHIAETVAEHIDFIVTTGDLVEQGLADEYKAFREILNLESVSQTPGPQLVTIYGLRRFPMYFLPGNHDDRHNFFRCLFPLNPPVTLANVTFQHKGIQFICLDLGPQRKAVVNSEVLHFLSRALESRLPSVLLMHHHLLPLGSRWLDSLIADNLGTFWEMVSEGKVLGIFCGHAHATYECYMKGTPVFGLRSTTFQFALQDEVLCCLQPPHYRLITIQDALLTTRIFEVPLL